MELTYIGFLTLEFRQQMRHIGLTENQVESTDRQRNSTPCTTSHIQPNVEGTYATRDSYDALAR
jgi:hypothetical protein